MATTYNLRTTDSDLSMGAADFAKALDTGADGSPTSLAVSVANGGAEEISFGFTAIGVPSSTGITGNYTITVGVVTADTNISLDVSVSRVSYDGVTVHSTSSRAGSQSLGSTGTKTFSLTSVDLGTWTSTGTGDRLRVNYVFTSAKTMGPAASVSIYYGDTSSQATAPWNTTVTHNLAGSIDGTGTVSGALTKTAPLSGAVAGTGTVSGALTKTVPLASAIAGTGTVSGALSVTTNLVGSVAGTGALAGALSQTVPLAGAIAGTGALSGTLTVTASAVALAGSIDGTGALAGALSVTKALASSIDGTGALAGALSVTKALAGAAAGAGALSGVLGVTKALAGSADGTGALAGALSVTKALAGAAAGAGALSGGLSVTKSLAGAMAGTGGLSGALTVTSGVVSLAGRIEGQSYLGGHLTIGCDCVETVSLKKVLDGVWALVDGSGTDQMETEDFRLATGAVRRNLKSLWEQENWPQLRKLDQRWWRPVWHGGKLYQAGDEVVYLPTRTYYTATAANVGEAPGSGSSWTRIEQADFQAYVARQQPGHCPVGRVFGVYDRHPLRHRNASRLDYALGNELTYVMTHRPAAWLEYQKPAPLLDPAVYSAATAYAPGDQVYDSTTGNAYECLQPTTAGESATSAPTKWKEVPIPRFLETALVAASAAEISRIYNRPAVPDDGELAAEEHYKLAQQHQHANPYVTHRG